jgi:hypothetical protein
VSKRSRDEETKAMQPTNMHLSNRDRAVLHAVADGRCRRISHILFIDGVYCADQFVADHLAEAGLLSAADPVRLTPSAQQLLKAA